MLCPSRAVKLLNIGGPQYIGVSHPLTYPSVPQVNERVCKRERGVKTVNTWGRKEDHQDGGARRIEAEVLEMQSNAYKFTNGICKN